MPAPMPSRKSASFTVTIGMIPITLDKFSSTESSAVHKSQYREVSTDDGQGNITKELHPVGNTAYDKITGQNVNRDDIIKCVEAADGTLVEVTDDELQAFQAENGTSEFIGFITASDFTANYVTEKAYQVRPSKPKVGGKTSKAESPFSKAFMLILDELRAQSKVALLKLTERGTPRYYALTPDGGLFSLYYDEEVRESRPLPIVELSDGEKKMGTVLVDKYTLTELPVLTDTTNTAIAEFVEQKAAAMSKGEKLALPEIKSEEASNDGQDLMALLSASLA